MIEVTVTIKQTNELSTEIINDVPQELSITTNIEKDL